jgi:hypothetical protein
VEDSNRPVYVPALNHRIGQQPAVHAIHSRQLMRLYCGKDQVHRKLYGREKGIVTGGSRWGGEMLSTVLAVLRTPFPCGATQNRYIDKLGEIY